MDTQIFELQYAMDTFYFLICGALVMWMAAGFSMLEAGLVRAKNTTEILTKNVALYAIACFMYMACGYAIMYDGGWFLSGIEAFNLDEVLATSAENADIDVSLAKIYAGQAAKFVAKEALQVHGAIGYTIECDLHMWMKRAWALAAAHGDAAFHRERVGRHIL